MKKSILIAGESGSGKSEVGRRLATLGYETYDIDSTPNLCMMVDKITKQPIKYDNNNDIEKMEKMLWLCKFEKLQEIINNQKNEIAFYCGSPNNIVEIAPAFRGIILLIANEQNTRQRLNARQDNGFGKSIQVQDYIIARKEGIEKSLQQQGAVLVNANQDIDAVLNDVIRIAKEL